MLKTFKNGLLTGLTLQLAIGPVFFYIVNLGLQKTIWDGLAGAAAVTIVDYFYIILAIFGVGKLLEKKKFKEIFGILSSSILIIFGAFIIYGLFNNETQITQEITSSNFLDSFLSVFLLTISSPMTIVFFTGLFTARAFELKYTKKDLYIFGFAVGLSTLIFMGSSVVLFTIFKEAIPLIIIQVLNFAVGALLVAYGAVRLFKTLKNNLNK